MSKIKTKKFKNNIRYQVMVSNDYILSKHDLGTQAQHVIIYFAKNIQKRIINTIISMKII